MNDTDMDKIQIVLNMGNTPKGVDTKIIMNTKEITVLVDIFNGVVLIHKFTFSRYILIKDYDFIDTYLIINGIWSLYLYIF